MAAMPRVASMVRNLCFTVTRYLPQLPRMTATLLRLRYVKKPIPASPISSIADVGGSGSEEAVGIIWKPVIVPLKLKLATDQSAPKT